MMLEQLPPQLFLGPEPKQELFNPIKNFERKPSGGLWTSTNDSGVSMWIVYCMLHSPERLKYPVWELHPIPCRVFTVNTEHDLHKLPSAQPSSPTYFRDPIVHYDWEAIAQDWDAIHLTYEGLERTKCSYPRSLWGWDCESTLWLRWMFGPIYSLGSAFSAIANSDH